MTQSKGHWALLMQRGPKGDSTLASPAREPGTKVGWLFPGSVLELGRDIHYSPQGRPKSHHELPEVSGPGPHIP